MQNIINSPFGGLEGAEPLHHLLHHFKSRRAIIYILLVYMRIKLPFLFRKVRKLPVFIPNNFEVFKADSVSEDLIGNLKYVTMAASIIGLITLLGAAVGLMNIMLVSVTERTREIGIRKAIGATSAEIKKPAMMAVNSPASGLSPLAMANAIAKGSATTPTVAPALKSLTKCCRV